MECLRLVLIGIILFITHNERYRRKNIHYYSTLKKEIFVLYLVSNSD